MLSETQYFPLLDNAAPLPTLKFPLGESCEDEPLRGPLAAEASESLAASAAAFLPLRAAHSKARAQFCFPRCWRRELPCSLPPGDQGGMRARGGVFRHFYQIRCGLPGREHERGFECQPGASRSVW